MLANAAYEPAAERSGRRPIEAGVLADLEVVMLMVTVIHRLNTEPGWQRAPQAARQAALAYDGALAAWLGGCATWVRSGTGGPAIETALPEPPRLGEGLGLAVRATWHRLLDTRLRGIMGQVMHGADLRAAGAAIHG